MKHPNTTLQHMRRLRGWSQAILAERIGTTGKNVSRWECGISQPSSHFCEQLCQLFAMDAQALGLLNAPNVAPPSPPSLPLFITPTTLQEPILDSLLPRLTVPISQIIGREALLDQILSALQPGTTCTLYGLPGVGKTTLAQLISLNSRCQALFPDGIFWVNSGSTPDVQAELVRLAAFLQAPSDERSRTGNIEDLSRSVQHLLRKRHLLLIIDDAWSLEAVLPLLVGGPHTAHLVTTRLPKVAMSLPGTQPFSVPELTIEQSQTLLTLLTPSLTESSVETLQQVVNSAGGLPLALTLLGFYLRTQTIGGQQRRIATALEQIADTSLRLHLVAPKLPTMSSSSLPGEIPWSLATIIGISEQHLPLEAQKALHALALLPAKPESFSERAALAVSKQDPTILDCLLDAGLIEGGGEGRYRIHQVIADYARLQQNEIAPRQRLVDYGRQICASFTIKRAHTLQDVKDDYLVVLAALQMALSLQQSQDVVQMVLALVPFWRTQDLSEQANKWVQLALSVAVPEQPEYAQLLAQWARFALSREAWKQARQDALRGLDLPTTLEQPAVHADFLQMLGLVAQHNDNNIQAHIYYEQGLQFARLGRDCEITCRLLNAQGMLASKQGNYHQAEALYQEGLGLALHEKHQELICQQLSNLGNVLQLQGDYPRSEQRLREGLALARQLSYRVRQIWLLLNLGVTLSLQGEYAQAKVFYLEGLALARQSEDHKLIKKFLMNLGILALEEQSYEQAECYLQEGLAKARLTNDMISSIILLTNLGVLYSKRAGFQKAQATFEECLPLARALNDPWILSNTLCRYAEVFLQNQSIDDAECGFQEALAVYQNHEPNRELITQAQFGLAQVLNLRGREEEAQQLAEQCLSTFIEMHHYYAHKVRVWLAHRPSPLSKSSLQTSKNGG